MIAALTGRPLLALLVACYVGVVLLLARACGMGGGWDGEWVDLDGEPCEHPRCPCRWGEAG